MVDVPSHLQGNISNVIPTPLALSKFAVMAVLLASSAPALCAAEIVPLSPPQQVQAPLLLVAASASQPEAFALGHDAEQAADEHHKAQALAQVAAPAAPVPELDTWALMLGGLGALVFITRRRLFA